MNSRGFFSVILATFAVVMLIALIYAQSVRSETDAKTNQILVLQQELSKDWFMARNAYSNFAADAMADKIKQVVSPPACSIDLDSVDFSVRIQEYWNLVYDKLSLKGIDCKAVLSHQLYSDMGEDEIHDHSGALAVHIDERAYGILTCLSSVRGMDLNMTQPFVIRKEVEVSVSAPDQCNVKVYDNLGANHVATDVDFTYP